MDCADRAHCMCTAHGSEGEHIVSRHGKCDGEPEVHWLTGSKVSATDGVVVECCWFTVSDDDVTDMELGPSADAKADRADADLAKVLIVKGKLIALPCCEVGWHSPRNLGCSRCGIIREKWCNDELEDCKEEKKSDDKEDRFPIWGYEGNLPCRYACWVRWLLHPSIMQQVPCPAWWSMRQYPVVHVLTVEMPCSFPSLTR